MNPYDMARFVLLMRDFKANQWKSREEIEEIQARKLERIVAFAKSSVPHYRRRLAGAHAAGPGAMGGLPVLEKEEVAKNPESFVSEGSRNLRTLSTSGSSGHPLRLVVGGDGLYGLALRYHCMTEAGFGPRDVLMNVLSFPLRPSFFQRFIYRVENFPVLDDERKTLEGMGRIRRGIYFGYPSTLAALGALNSELERPLSFRKIITTSETLTPSVRLMAEKSFSCRVSDYYGTNECGALAWECAMGSLHAIPDSAIIEIVDEEGQPAGEGKRGDLLLTSLWRTTMPFIRYRIGDVGCFRGKCKCGRSGQILSVEGRASSFIILPSGRKFAWHKIQLRLRHVGGILQFQGMQDSPERLSISLVPSARPSEGIAENAREIAASMLPERMDVKIEWAGKIGRGKSGKATDFIPLRGA